MTALTLVIARALKIGRARALVVRVVGSKTVNNHRETRGKARCDPSDFPASVWAMVDVDVDVNVNVMTIRCLRTDKAMESGLVVHPAI